MMSNTEIVQQESIISALIVNGDLSKLNPQEKVIYYKGYCERLGLDHFTKPFDLLTLNGKQVLYCTRSGAQQLNKLHKVSHKITAREVVNDCYVVTACAYTPDQRQTESIGAVNIANLKGEALCNAMMKAETKAKRRSTLDLLGLGVLDESETDTIKDAQFTPILEIDGKQADIDLELWQEQINQCKDTVELKKLYKSNEEVANANMKIFEMFSARKTELINAQKQAA